MTRSWEKKFLKNSFLIFSRLAIVRLAVKKICVDKTFEITTFVQSGLFGFDNRFHTQAGTLSTVV
jgi:hypothetical protein